MTLTLRPDLVLVALPPSVSERVTAAGLVTIEPDRPAQAGVVRQVGTAVQDVAPGDRVLFGLAVGQPVEWEAWPHLLLREQDIDAVLDAADEESHA